MNTKRRAPMLDCNKPKLSVMAFATLYLVGCQHLSDNVLPDRTQPAQEAPSWPAQAASTAAGTPNVQPASTSSPSTRLFSTPPLTVTGKQSTRTNASGANPSEPEVDSSVALEQLPLPVFIETVYAGILKRNVSMDPAIAQRKELVSLKSGKPLTGTALAETAKAVLRSYGLAVNEYENLVRVTPLSGNSGYLPELMRGRALPETPTSLRPIFFLAELENVSPINVVNWLKTLFGERVSVSEDIPRQALLLGGQIDDVNAAIEAIRVLDQPLMRGRMSARIAPLFWSADELSRRLGEVLGAQGFTVGQAANAQAPIILLPIGPLNSIIAFASSEQTLNHVLRWATELDQPASGRGSAGYFTYPVRNMDAGELAKTLQEVMVPAGTGGAGTTAKSRVVVNPASNTLIIQGNPSEYQQWFGLLQELDRPARTALVSVTIAEVRLTNTEQMGFEWLLRQFTLGGFNVNLRNSLGVSSSNNLVATFSSRSSSTNALLNLLASTGKARILANPSVLARNGELATLQVGQDVPIITQQQQLTQNTSGVPGGVPQNNGNILQSIQYRNTGIILKVKPVIHAGGRVDLDVEQEVSTALRTTIGVTSTPTFQNRRLNTKLSVADGTTVMLGGLMQEENKRDDSGIPILKDIPLAGHLFKQSTDTRERTELVVLVTPYVINDEFEARAISDAFRRQFSWDASSPSQHLRPPQSGQQPMLTPQALRLESASKPYILPPADAEPLVQPGGPKSEAGDVARRQQQPRDFPDQRDPKLPQDTRSNNSRTEATSKPSQEQTQKGGAQGTGTGKPVDDPQILKELMDAVNRKR